MIESGADSKRKNAAKLKIHSIKEDGIHVVSTSSKSQRKFLIKYPHLQILINNYQKLDPKSITKAVNDVLKNAGLESDYTTETYLYSFAKAYFDRRRLHPVNRREPYLNTDAIDDIGADAPEKVRGAVWSYARDAKIRKAVMRRAKGKCEFCGELVFKRVDGTYYLECHHIIALAKDGSDRMTNVIALCPNHHREAHFGQQSIELEIQMIEKVRLIEGKVKTGSQNG